MNRNYNIITKEISNTIIQRLQFQKQGNNCIVIRKKYKRRQYINYSRVVALQQKIQNILFDKRKLRVKE